MLLIQGKTLPKSAAHILRFHILDFTFQICPPYGVTVPNLAAQGPFAADVGQEMIDQVVGECIAHEEWREPEVESEIPPGPAGADPALYNIGTPIGSAPVPMEHDLVLPPSTLKQRESPRTPEEEPEATRLTNGALTGRGTINHGSSLSQWPQTRLHGLLKTVLGERGGRPTVHAKGHSNAAC